MRALLATTVPETCESSKNLLERRYDHGDEKCHLDRLLPSECDKNCYQGGDGGRRKSELFQKMGSILTRRCDVRKIHLLNALEKREEIARKQQNY